VAEEQADSEVVGSAAEGAAEVADLAVAAEAADSGVVGSAAGWAAVVRAEDSEAEDSVG
jgi:hypothetical protein